MYRCCGPAECEAIGFDWTSRATDPADPSALETVGLNRTGAPLDVFVVAPRPGAAGLYLRDNLPDNRCENASPAATDGGYSGADPGVAALQRTASCGSRLTYGTRYHSVEVPPRTRLEVSGYESAYHLSEVLELLPSCGAAEALDCATWVELSGGRALTWSNTGAEARRVWIVGGFLAPYNALVDRNEQSYAFRVALRPL